MAPLKQKGDHAELEVARDLVRRGYRTAIPYGEDWDFDLIFQRPGCNNLERVQVKYAKRKGDVIPLSGRSVSLTNGKVKRIKRYTAATRLARSIRAAVRPLLLRSRRRTRERDGWGQSSTHADAELPAEAC